MFFFFKKIFSLSFFFFSFPENKKQKKRTFSIPKEILGELTKLIHDPLKDLDSINNMQKSCQVRQSLVAQGFDSVPRMEGR